MIGRERLGYAAALVKPHCPRAATDSSVFDQYAYVLSPHTIFVERGGAERDLAQVCRAAG